ncbi:metal-sensitive transcriptional regulator [Xylophilus sp.]|uniref:metal-sensitive transcriptional regulator n=1 Tax=Xylophilus sp. TaxID=2653893 RepID=UPI0013BE3204|nr:metal-sensitive transcriptional regulator [Xylophilus sp.]KAF1046210.1 MAG: hypothetical protein GAK38_02607 [Xylophilus sp.]
MAALTDATKKKALQARLSRAEGQVRGVLKLVREDADYERVSQQLAAARKALDRAFFSLVGDAIEQGELTPEQVAALLAKFA